MCREGLITSRRYLKLGESLGSLLHAEAFLGAVVVCPIYLLSVFCVCVLSCIVLFNQH